MSTLRHSVYQAVALEGKKIHWCYFGLYSELCVQDGLPGLIGIILNICCDLISLVKRGKNFILNLCGHDMLILIDLRRPDVLLAFLRGAYALSPIFCGPCVLFPVFCGPCVLLPAIRRLYGSILVHVGSILGHVR